MLIASRALSAISIDASIRQKGSSASRRAGASCRSAFLLALSVSVIASSFAGHDKRRSSARLYKMRQQVTIHTTGEEVDPGTYKVGGHRVFQPTGRNRDSSLGINKAPGKCLSCREAQTVRMN